MNDACPRRLPAPVWGGAAAALGLAAVALVAWPGADSLTRFRARGPDEPTALVLRVGSPATNVLAFRTDGGDPGALLTRRFPASAEVAFAYRNGGGWQRLMVFARDDLGQIYWYQPPWIDGRKDPEGVALAAGPGLHELPEAVAHTIRGARVALCVLLTRRTLTVQQVERRLASAPGRPAADVLSAAGEETSCRELEVAR